MLPNLMTYTGEKASLDEICNKFNLYTYICTCKCEALYIAAWIFQGELVTISVVVVDQGHCTQHVLVCTTVPLHHTLCNHEPT